MPFCLHFILGYLLSVLVATFFALSVFIFAYLVDQNPDPYVSMGGIFMITSIIVFFSAFPGYSFAIYLAGFSSDKTHLYWTAAGVLNAILALVIFFVFASPLFSASLIPFAMFGGSIGGFAYSLFRRLYPFI